MRLKGRNNEPLVSKGFIEDPTFHARKPMKRTILNYFFYKNGSTSQKSAGKSPNYQGQDKNQSPSGFAANSSIGKVIVISSDDEDESYTRRIFPLQKKQKFSLKRRHLNKEKENTKFGKAETEVDDNADIFLNSSITKLDKTNAVSWSFAAKNSIVNEEKSSLSITNSNVAVISDVVQTDAAETKPKLNHDPDRMPYYLENFKLAIDTVMNDATDATLFEGADATWVAKFYSLPPLSQRLYVRLFHRKLAWLPLNKISYKEISDDLTAWLQALVDNGFLECILSDGGTVLALTELLCLLPAPTLKNLAKSLHVSVIGQKEKISSAIHNLCKKQRSVVTKSSSLEETVTKRALKLLGPCYKIALLPKQIFNRVMLVFDVTKGTEDDSEFSFAGRSNSNQPGYYGRNHQLASILLAGMGRVVYPSYTIKKSVPIFERRSELLEYETACHHQSEVFSAAESGQWKVALEACERSVASEKAICEESRKRTATLPHFIRSFSASAVHTRIKSLQVEILQRLKNYQRACDLLQELLDQEAFCVSRRGFWAERLALNLDQHLQNPKASLEVIEKALRDPYVRVGHVTALVERAEKIKTSKKVTSYDFNKILQDYSFLKANEVTIVGRLLPKRMQTGKARFMKIKEGVDESDDVLLCSVEELALDHYKCEGYDQGLHAEGSTFTCFFSLLMWDIIFMCDIDDVFRTPYQTHPLDYITDEFYTNRKVHIDRRIEEISDWESDRFSARQLMTEHWNTHKDVTCTGMNWERFSSLQQLLVLADCIGGKVMAGIMQLLAKDPRHTRSGLPDLVVWSSTTNAYKLVEVKGPGDKLFGNQKMWMHHLVSLGAHVEVCHVTANASRKLGK